ncbi:hypothetical protein C5C45_00510 [Rathayibacter rathayi]|uniref:Uncharacterized protein n=2 Tax=Rathayibacter rathayi TaxID=33887 RepID=A0ABX5AGX0_RATRA|nr:hypothetical protein C5C34_05905 [Rathayibacter rathayi]PPF51585.1 hypothetical protein C5C08_01895 [Rathayibacter rathayi]PPF83176.1 hypothetical protein C5C14_01935 [Rathayibacter rathayi]PPG47006.1 hypothetical protein C5C20_01890 [Rathayibacter rathayi]PPG96533.1 hypothetical protein C5C22_02635 [Rathayibacter rathayi]
MLQTMLWDDRRRLVVSSHGERLMTMAMMPAYIADMSDWNSNDHPRGHHANPGGFSGRAHSDPEGMLVSVRAGRSHDNPVLCMLRDTARLLGKPQSVVAGNWLRSPATTTFRADQSPGVSADEFESAMSLLRRLASVR